VARTIAQVKADLITIWSLAKSAGLKVYQTDILPRTNTTDAWATTVNQTPYVNFEANGTSHRDTLNTWLPTQVGGGGPLDGVIPVADIVEDATTRGVWKAGTFTADGTHPQPSTYTSMAARINAWAAANS
jgi:lysophospholipase L1-like esterase